MEKLPGYDDWKLGNGLEGGYLCDRCDGVLNEDEYTEYHIPGVGGRYLCSECLARYVDELKLSWEDFV